MNTNILKDFLYEVENRCTACTACMNICSNQAINMMRDRKGFWKAYVDNKKCSKCGKCIGACHLTKKEAIVYNRDPVYYAAFSKDIDNVGQSSSGGIFYELCKTILKQSGAVYGAVQTSVFEVVHQRGTTLEEIVFFRRSKYLESKLGTCYKEVKQDLENGKKVLFSGVGCQIAGLYCYLQEDYEDLYTCEVVCHGIPSYQAYDKYLQEKSEQYGDAINGINFRDKSFGWSNNAICEYFEKGKRDIIYSNLHPLHSLYLKGINMRGDCGSCPYARIPRIADITLADFWKYEGKLLEMNYNRGLSLIAANNERGKHLLGGILENIYYEKIDKKMALKSCRHMAHSPLLHKSQEVFMWLLQRTSFQFAADICSSFGPVIKETELCKMDEIDEDYILDTFWRNEQEIVYLLDRMNRVEGIVTYGSFIRNYADRDNWVNYCFRKVVFSEKCIQEIKDIFASEEKINRIPIVDQKGCLIFEVRRNDIEVVPYQLNEKFLETLVRYERIFNKKRLVILNEKKQWEHEDVASSIFIVNTVCKKNILKQKYCLDSVYGEEYCKETKFIEPFLRLYCREIKVYYIRRPELLLDDDYTYEERIRIKEEESFPKLSENIKENESILKDFFKEKFSYTYIEGLRKIPQIIEKSGRYQHVDYSSAHINVVGGYRKTEYQPQEYYNTIHIYGRCGVFGYAVEDSDTMPSALQYLFTKSGQKVRIINHGLWGADDEKILHNLLIDIKEEIIKRDDMVVIYMDYLPYMERLKNLNVHIHDTTIPFHEFKKSGLIFFDKPGHMTAEGYQYIAEFIYQIINNPYLMEVNKEKQQVIKEFLRYHTKIDEREEKNEIELEKYISGIKAKISGKMDLEKKTGAIVMNCNPFTKGHRYLIETALGEVDNLLVFVLEEDKSFFPFLDRFQMVKDGTRDLENVYVLPSGRFMISAMTFPEYFIKEQKQDIMINPITDVQIFAKDIAPQLHISVRFVGTEPKDKVTAQYNNVLKEQLPIYGIVFREVDRLEKGGKVVTATEVRNWIREQKYDRLKKFVPMTTYDYLLEHGYLNERGKSS